MFKSKELIYIQLQKTACTHIASLLCQLFDGELVGKHNAATPDQIRLNQYFISSIRNPWEWYLSLWTFGVQGQGGFMRRLTNSKNLKSFYKMSNGQELLNAELDQEAKVWRSLYEPAANVESFRKWLKLIHSPENSHYISNSYEDVSIVSQCGFMTYRYLLLCCNNISLLKNDKLVFDYNRLVKFEHDNCYIDYFIRQESLEDTLCEAMERIRPVTLEEKELIYGADKVNSSVRKLSILDYYDKESIELVKIKDRLIVEKFGYFPPC